MSDEYAERYRGVDFRRHPELYRIGRGEQGVLIAEPYRSEILPLWRFKDPATARESSEAIYTRFLEYRAAGDFVGMDMARKFLQMGFTRARRYANHRSGRKWNGAHDEILPEAADPVKAESAEIFRRRWADARSDPDYLRMKREHRKRYEAQ